MQPHRRTKGTAPVSLFEAGRSSRYAWVYNPSTLGSTPITGTITFEDGSNSFEWFAFSIEAKQGIEVRPEFSLAANQELKIKLDSGVSGHLEVYVE